MTNSNNFYLFGEGYDTVLTSIIAPPPVKLFTSESIYIKYDMLNIMKQVELLKPITLKKQRNIEISNDTISELTTTDNDINYDSDDDFEMPENIQDVSDKLNELTTLGEETSSPDGLILYEKPDITAIDKLLNSTLLQTVNYQKKNDRKHLETYRGLINHSGLVEVSYKKNTP